MTTNQQAEVSTNPQAEVSMEDRILGAMGEELEAPETIEVEEQPQEETQEEEAAPEEPSEELEEIEIDGEVWQVPPKIKEGILRQQDYTRKTQEVAAERQTLQEQRQAVEQERQAFVQQVQAQQQNFQLHAQIASIDQQIAQYQNIDWQQLIDQDPVEAMKLDKGLQNLKESRNQYVQQAIQQQQQMSQYEMQQRAQLLEKGNAELQRLIPDWSPDKAKAITSFSIDTYGFNQQEMQSIIDPRHVQVLHDAMKYRELLASKPNVQNKVSVAPKLVKAGAQQPKQSNTDVLKKIVKTSSDKNARNNAIQRLLESRL